ncbi:MAG TPA: hypothetical protein VNW97_18775 [Candidatus Saccharimonadales bacterium]|jgi:hypothetical protein|nr:hypothetical protein [Candidatus Saccharimonadales bacterium]
MANSINVTATDNQLILIAFQWGACFEICSILSGNSNTVNATFNIQPGVWQGGMTLNGVSGPIGPSAYPIYLPAGSYQLAAIGINWGGPTQFTFTFNGNTYALPYSATGNDGVSWTPTAIQFTV